MLRAPPLTCMDWRLFGFEHGLWSRRGVQGAIALLAQDPRPRLRAPCKVARAFVFGWVITESSTRVRAGDCENSSVRLWRRTTAGPTPSPVGIDRDASVGERADEFRAGLVIGLRP